MAEIEERSTESLERMIGNPIDELERAPRASECCSTRWQNRSGSNVKSLKGGFRDPAGHVVRARYRCPSGPGELASHPALTRAARPGQGRDGSHGLGGLLMR